LIEIVTAAKPLELTGSWPQVMNTGKAPGTPISA